MTVATILLILALVFFILSALPIPTRGVNWQALGFVCITLFLLLGNGLKLAN